MTRAFLSLGSNLGDRLENLRSSAAALDRGTWVSVVWASKVYETEPVEVEEGHPDYLNCAVEVECGMSAVELLRFCQGVEAALGRDEKGSMAPRTVDVDVLLFGEEEILVRDLTIPHHGITRSFNLRCIADLDPDLRIPGFGVVGELLKSAKLDGVREFEGAEVWRKGESATFPET
ncbi:MAG: 2-amino-4-hydroxy-6-hydroxymethyldihydropteridine diphosphokinase [Rubrobacter sp.]|jgi:2-amino-4-hydroxy-6-hydroxymethyldihydropteridine diphosphokinase|nr:2-amino-4-hydroxy-6-hydroxymethyldihydropteridine diphosphokinase [Rubrobacter sp.]